MTDIKVIYYSDSIRIILTFPFSGEHSSELRPDTLLASDDSIKLCFNVFTALVSGLIINIIN